MSLAELFTERELILDFAPSDKWDAIRLLVERLVETGLLPAERSSAMRDAVVARERTMATGLEKGIALPHASVDGIDRVLAAMGVVRSEKGLDFASVDGRPARLIVLLLVPRQQKVLHIRTLKEVAIVLGKEPVRERILAAATPREAYEALVADGKRV